MLWILSFVLFWFSGKLGHPLPGDRFIHPPGLLCASGARPLACPVLLQGSSGIQPFWWSGSFRRSKKWEGPLCDPLRSRPISPHAPNERPQPTQLVHAHCTWCCRTQPSADLHAGLDVGSELVGKLAFSEGPRDLPRHRACGGPRKVPPRHRWKASAVGRCPRYNPRNVLCPPTPSHHLPEHAWPHQANPSLSCRPVSSSSS